jgi:uncharacterized protein YjbI with pentapeptide repeats
VANQDSIFVVAIVVISVAALAVPFGIWWLWWRLPKWQVDRLALKIRDPKARADVEDNFRKTVGQALGGAAVLIGAGFALFQFLQGQNQFREQQQAAHDLLISNQVSKGFEQLASDKIAMRLGGIYALEGVMNDKTSKQYYGPVLEGLCAFVRESTIGETLSEKQPATDVQAALTVIGRRIKGLGSVNLANARISEAYLVEADLLGANLTKADLTKADLTKADLTKADLTRAVLSGANLTAANLSSANLTAANLSSANLFGTNLSSAKLTAANLSSANLFGTDLSSAILGAANLSGAELWFANLSGTNLIEANLSGANLIEANLSGANLSGADLRGAQLTQTELDEACGDSDTKPPEGLTPPKLCPPIVLR